LLKLSFFCLRFSAFSEYQCCQNFEAKVCAIIVKLSQVVELNDVVTAANTVKAALLN